MRFSVVSILALPLLAAATAVPRTEQCDTGGLACCGSTQAANTPGLSTILGLLGVILNPITGLVGFTCSPLTLIGLANNECTTQPVCCTNNHFNVGVSLGCSPINL